MTSPSSSGSRSSPSPSRNKYVPPSRRFADVEPLPQDDPENSLVVIDYEPIFAEIHAYFRAFYTNQEYSARGLRLSAEVIECNAANYTAWWYRRKCLEKLQKESESRTGKTNNGAANDEVVLAEPNLYEQELHEFCREWLERSTKNYQVWYHRKWLIEKLYLLPRPSADERRGGDTGEQEDGQKDAKTTILRTNALLEELKLMRYLLLKTSDHKVYNVWSHRLMILRNWFREDRDVLQMELQYSEEMLDQDVWNNSAWNHRWTIREMLASCPRQATPSSSSSTANGQSEARPPLNREAEALQELRFVKSQLLLADRNEAAWNYLSALTEVSFPDLIEPGDGKEPRIGKFLAKEIIDFFNENKNRSGEVEKSNPGATTISNSTSEGPASSARPGGLAPNLFALKFEAHLYLVLARNAIRLQKEKINGAVGGGEEATSTKRQGVEENERPPPAEVTNGKINGHSTTSTSKAESCEMQVLPASPTGQQQLSLELRLQQGLNWSLSHYKNLKTLDPIREHYWHWKAEWLQKEFGNFVEWRVQVAGGDGGSSTGREEVRQNGGENATNLVQYQ
ncbi:unnamed protein product [Amoebophrya sp. A120]|nr:unnamed protein product [Amoebophrya sp. A120]|eukprot:GSA120T00007967001.1